jgi:putative effector of murein hydrolase
MSYVVAIIAGLTFFFAFAWASERWSPIVTIPLLIGLFLLARILYG